MTKRKIEMQKMYSGKNELHYKEIKNAAKMCIEWIVNTNDFK